MKLQHVKSSFPLAVGAEISAVDNDCFSATGKAFSFIALGNAESSTEKTLQEDDVSCHFSSSRTRHFRCPPLPPPRACRFRLRTTLRRSSRGIPLRTCRRRGWEHKPRTPPRRQPRRFHADASHPLSQIHEVQARRFVLVSAECARNTRIPSHKTTLLTPSPPRPQPPDRVRGTHLAAPSSPPVRCLSVAPARRSPRTPSTPPRAGLPRPAPATHRLPPRVPGRRKLQMGEISMM